MSNDLTRMADRIKRLPRRLKRLVNVDIAAKMRRAAKVARATLIAKDTVATTNLVSSTRYRPRHGPSPEAPPVSQAAGDTYGTHLVRADAPYAPYVEYGTGIRQSRPGPFGDRYRSPSTKPTGHIYEWLRAKPQMDADWGTAHAIAEDIKRFGNEAQPFLREGWFAIGGTDGLKRTHARGVRRAIRRTLRGF